MKSLISILLGLFFIGNAIGQDKFTVPELSLEQKHNRVNSQIPAFLSAGISFAKTKDVTPYEYGKYVGKLFASTWDKDAGFDGFVNGMIFISESGRSNEDRLIEIKENGDGSVTIIRPPGPMSKYGNAFATIEERNECMTGVLEQIAKYMGCTISREDTELTSIITIKKK
jgi:hypothetical protein